MYYTRDHDLNHTQYIKTHYNFSHSETVLYYADSEDEHRATTVILIHRHLYGPFHPETPEAAAEKWSSPLAQTLLSGNSTCDCGEETIPAVGGDFCQHHHSSITNSFSIRPGTPQHLISSTETAAATDETHQKLMQTIIKYGGIRLQFLKRPQKPLQRNWYHQLHEMPLLRKLLHHYCDPDLIH